MNSLLLGQSDFLLCFLMKSLEYRPSKSKIFEDNSVFLVVDSEMPPTKFRRFGQWPNLPNRQFRLCLYAIIENLALSTVIESHQESLRNHSHFQLLVAHANSSRLIAGRVFGCHLQGRRNEARQKKSTARQCLFNLG